MAQRTWASRSLDKRGDAGNEVLLTAWEVEELKETEQQEQITVTAGEVKRRQGKAQTFLNELLSELYFTEATLSQVCAAFVLFLTETSAERLSAFGVFENEKHLSGSRDDESGVRLRKTLSYTENIVQGNKETQMDVTRCTLRGCQQPPCCLAT